MPILADNGLLRVCGGELVYALVSLRADPSSDDFDAHSLGCQLAQRHVKVHARECVQGSSAQGQLHQHFYSGPLMLHSPCRACYFEQKT